MKLWDFSIFQGQVVKRSLFQISKALAVFERNGIDPEIFQQVPQYEDCVYDNPDFPACDE